MTINKGKLRSALCKVCTMNNGGCLYRVSVISDWGSDMGKKIWLLINESLSVLKRHIPYSAGNMPYLSFLMQ